MGKMALDQAMLEWKSRNGGDYASCIDMPDAEIVRACLSAVIERVRADERERCAKVADGYADHHWDAGDNLAQQNRSWRYREGQYKAGERIAAAIRANGGGEAV